MGVVAGHENDEPSIPAGTFKATCLRVLDDVAVSGQPVTITKRGKPVARVVPAFQEEPDEAPPSLFGALAGTVMIVGDIMAPLEEDWEVLR